MAAHPPCRRGEGEREEVVLRCDSLFPLGLASGFRLRFSPRRPTWFAPVRRRVRVHSRWKGRSALVCLSTRPCCLLLLELVEGVLVATACRDLGRHGGVAGNLDACFFLGSWAARWRCKEPGHLLVPREC